MTGDYCYDPVFGGWYSKKNPYAKKPPKARRDLERRVYPKEQNLSARESDLHKEEYCPHCDLADRCVLCQTRDGRYHLCLAESEGYWSNILQCKIWYRRLWIYDRREATVVKLADYMDSIISKLMEDGEAGSVRDLSRTSGVPLTTCQKIVSGLIDIGVLQKEEKIINNRAHHVITLEEAELTDFLFQSNGVKEEDSRCRISTILFPEED